MHRLPLPYWREPIRSALVVVIALAGAACTPPAAGGDGVSLVDAGLDDEGQGGTATGGRTGRAGEGGGGGRDATGGAGGAEPAKDAPLAMDVFVLSPDGSSALDSSPVVDAVPVPDRAMKPEAGPLVIGKWTGGPLLIAVGDDGRRMTSVDGKTWIQNENPAKGSAPEKGYRDVAYANGVVVAVGGNCDAATSVCTARVSTTTDGKAWTDPMLPADIGRLLGVAYGAGTWVAIGSRGPALYSHDNGDTWGRNELSIGRPTGLRAIAYGPVGGVPMFVGVGDRFVRARSLDGIEWTDSVEISGTSGRFDAVAIGAGAVLAVGSASSMNNGLRIRSVDGKNWSDQIIAAPPLSEAFFSEGRFFVFSAAGANTLFTSPLGEVATWTSQLGATTIAGATVTIQMPDNLGIHNMGGKRTFIGRRGSGSMSPLEIRSSTDGLNWITDWKGSANNEANVNKWVFVPGS